jgi:hypothetical protein
LDGLVQFNIRQLQWCCNTTMTYTHTPL